MTLEEHLKRVSHWLLTACPVLSNCKHLKNKIKKLVGRVTRTQVDSLWCLTIPSREHFILRSEYFFLFVAKNATMVSLTERGINGQCNIFDFITERKNKFIAHFVV